MRRRLPFVQSLDDVFGLVKKIVNLGVVALDDEFLVSLVHLGLVEEHHHVVVRQPQVQPALAHVTGKRALDRPPQPFDVDNALTLSGLVSVLAQ